MEQSDKMKALIRAELQSIRDLGERTVFKDLMEGVFLSLYETNQQMYQQLEERVFSDLSYDVNQYLIQTGLVERACYDPTHSFLTAMREEDMNSVELTVKEARQAMEKEGRCLLGTVFLEGDFLDIKTLLDKQPQVRGMLNIGQEYETVFCIEQNRSYLAQVEQLYHLFLKNGVPWQTVSSPYLFKFVDVYAKTIPEECGEGERVISFRMEPDVSDVSMRYDLIPIWNVWKFKLDSMGFSVACNDHKGYEHELSIEGFGEDGVYLIDGGTGIASVRRNGQKLTLISPEKTTTEWEVISIRPGKEGRIAAYPYPLMQNHREDGFAERFQRKTGRVVKTKGELERFVRGFGLENYLMYTGCRILDSSEILTETYPVNFYRKDEIRMGRRQTQLLLSFQKQGQAATWWILRDLMSFLVAEVQELYPEYECGGCLE